MGRREVMDVADAISIFDFGAEGMFVPVASGTLQNAGYYDDAQSISRLATPLDFATLQSIPPPASWQQFHIVIDEITVRLLQQGALDEVMAWAESTGIVAADANGRRQVTFGLHLMISNFEDFATGAGRAYSRYIEEQAQSYLDLVVKGLPWMFETYACGAGIGVDAASLLAMVGDHLSSQSDSRLDMTIATLETWIAGNPPSPVPGMKVDCNGLLDALKMLRTATDAYKSANAWLSQDLTEIWEDLGYVALFVAETLRSPELARAISAATGAGQSTPVQAEEIGEIYGTLIGVVMWEIIEEVMTAGIGKGARIFKVVR